MTHHEKAIEEMKEYLRELDKAEQTPFIRREQKTIKEMIKQFK